MGEYDRRVEILLKGIGRVSAFARNARKPGSPLVSVTRVFAFGTFHLYQGKNSYSLNSAQIQDYFEELTGDYDAACYGFYFLEMAQYFSRENVEASGMLKLLYYSLKALYKTRVPAPLIRSIYELKILDFNGLCPTEERLFSAEGVYSFASHLSESCRKAFRYVVNAPVEKLYTFLLSGQVLEEFSSLTDHLVKQSTDRQFKSLSLITDSV